MRLSWLEVAYSRRLFCSGQFSPFVPLKLVRLTERPDIHTCPQRDNILTSLYEQPAALRTLHILSSFKSSLNFKRDNPDTASKHQQQKTTKNNGNNIGS